jgi:hypothetical protein
MKSFSLLIALLALTFSVPAQANLELERKMLRTVDSIETVFEMHYGPSNWKQMLFGWTFEQEFNELREKIRGDKFKNSHQFRRAIFDAIFMARDLHVKAEAYSFESSKLPLGMNSAFDSDGKKRYFVSWVDKSYQRSHPGIEVGDEIISYNDLPIEEAVKKLERPYFNQNSRPTERLAEIELFERYVWKGQETEVGSARVVFKQKKNARLFQRKMDWKVEPETLPPHPELEFKVAFTNRFKQGNKKSFFPELGEITYQTKNNDPFYAYIFKGKDGKKYGYIRIHTFSRPAHARQVSFFIEQIKRFEEETEALVVDVTNNPGGRIPFCYALTSVLNPQEMLAPRYRFKLSMKDIVAANVTLKKAELVNNERAALFLFGATYSGYPMSMNVVNDLKAEAEHFISEWSEGNTFTGPLFSQGVEFIHPHPKATHYTRPILVLANELSMSAAEIFTSILKDSGRAKVLGVPTAGAGGTVETFELQNHFGIKNISITKSLILRANGQAIENIGVSPDYRTELTVDDFQNQFAPYRQKILNTLKSLK